jgi:hypothetical protein
VCETVYEILLSFRFFYTFHGAAEVCFGETDLKCIREE